MQNFKALIEGIEQNKSFINKEIDNYFDNFENVLVKN